jgi:hypothetical protein
MPVIAMDSPEGCIQALMQYCEELLAENLTLHRIAPTFVPDWLDEYDRARVEIQRRVGPEFHQLSQLSRNKDWKQLQQSLGQAVDKLKQDRP